MLCEKQAEITTFFNWCYWNEDEKYILFTDIVPNHSAAYNRFKKHILKYVPPGSKVKFKKIDRNSKWFINVRVYIKN